MRGHVLKGDRDKADPVCGDQRLLIRQGPVTFDPLVGHRHVPSDSGLCDSDEFFSLTRQVSAVHPINRDILQRLIVRHGLPTS